MNLAVLQLSDLNLHIETDGGHTYSERGFALLTDSGVVTGDRAWASNWLQPHYAFSHYWEQLNQTPLPLKHAHARHHADIAYAQLQQILRAVDNPTQLILSVTSQFSDQQLSLLLGLLKALNIEVMGIIDSALAASIANPKAQIVVEVQLYQSCLSEIDRQPKYIKVLRQTNLPDLGIMPLYNLVAGHLSRQLIDRYRYDPLHSSVVEQQIFNQIPDWLQQLTVQNEIGVQLESPQGELSTVIKRQAIAQLFLQRLESLEPHLEMGGEGIYFSQDAGFIPMIINELKGCCPLQTSLSVESYKQLIVQHPQDQLQRITTLSTELTAFLKSSKQKNKQSVTARSASHKTAMHLLYRNHAYPLHKPISISRRGKQLRVSSGADGDAELVIVQVSNQLKVLTQQTNIQIDLPAVVRAGETFTVADQSLCLIEVNDG